MYDLRKKLNDRLQDRFFGFSAQCILKSELIPAAMKKSIESNLCAALQKAVTYLEQWFDFSSGAVTRLLQPGVDLRVWGPCSKRSVGALAQEIGHKLLLSSSLTQPWHYSC